MQYFCNMQDNVCMDVFTILDSFDLIDCIHPSLYPLYKGNKVPSYVSGLWTIDSQGVWSDPVGVRWPNGVPDGITPYDPNYTGPWPIPQEEPETPEEVSE